MHKEGFSIKKLSTIQQFHQCEELQRRVWGLSDTDIIPLHLLLTAQKSGGLVLGPTHLVEPEVPLENIEVYLEAIKSWNNNNETEQEA